MADLVRHRVAVIANARQLGFRAVTTRRSIHPDTPLETCAVMRDNEFIVA